MIAYVLLMLVTIATAFVAVRIYRVISGTAPSNEVFSPDSRIVMLSAGNGQWQLGRQHGFVRPDRRVSKPKARMKSRTVNTGKPSNRKPWGW